MIKRTVRKIGLKKKSGNSDLQYWLSKTPEQRISAVEILRRQHDGRPKRLRRVARVIKLKKR